MIDGEETDGIPEANVRGAWVLLLFVVLVGAWVAWRAWDAATWPQDTVAEVMRYCGDGPAADPRACVAFVRDSIGSWHRQGVDGRLFGARGPAPCAARAAEAEDDELRRAFAEWAERSWGRRGGQAFAHWEMPQFLRERFACG